MNARYKLVAIAVAVLIASLSLLALLQIYRFQHILVEVESSLVSVSAQTLKGNIERSLGIGLQLHENGQLAQMLEQARQQNPAILSLHLVDVEGDFGKLLWQAGPPLEGAAKIVQKQMRSPNAMWFGAGDASGFLQAWPINDPIGRVVANLVLRFDKAKPMAKVAAAGHYLLLAWAGLGVSSLIILIPLMSRLLTALDLGLRQPASVVAPSLIKRASLLLIALGLCATCLLTTLALQRFQTILLPTILAKGTETGISVRNSIQGAIALGIPFESLVGMEEFLANTLAENPEIAFIKIQHDSRDGYVWPPAAAIRAQRDDVISQVIPGSADLPPMIVGVRASFVKEKLYVMFGDALAMLFVTLVAGLEVVLFAISRWLQNPAPAWTRQAANQPVWNTAGTDAEAGWRRAGRQKWEQLRQRWRASLPTVAMARDVRLALFLFVLAEEVLRSFFPLHVKELASSGSRLALELSIGAPLIAFLFFAGIGTLYCSEWIERKGVRRAFTTGVILTGVSMFGLALARSLPEVIFLRSVGALGYAISTVACQVYIVRTAHADSRARDMAISVSAITAACVCGAPIGALMADMLGNTVAFLFASLLALLSWLAFSAAAVPAAAGPSAQVARPDDAGFLPMLSQWRISAIIVGGIIPGRMLMAGMLFYITPLLLQKYALAQASIGQFFLLFYALLLGGNHVFSRMADDDASQIRRMVIGALISGLGLLSLFWFNSALALAGAIVCFGFGQSLAQTPQNVIALKLVRESLPQVPTPKAISLLRACERIGGILGVAAAVILSVLLDYRIAAAALGALMFVMALATLPLTFHFASPGKSR